MSKSKIFYAKVWGLRPGTPKEEVIGYLQTARCGNGKVTELTWIGDTMTAAIVGIEGVSKKKSDKLKKGKHYLNDWEIYIEDGGPPTEAQKTRSNAVTTQSCMKQQSQQKPPTPSSTKRASHSPKTDQLIVSEDSFPSLTLDEPMNLSAHEKESTKPLYAAATASKKQKNNVKSTNHEKSKEHQIVEKRCSADKGPDFPITSVKHKHGHLSHSVEKSHGNPQENVKRSSSHAPIQVKTSSGHDPTKAKSERSQKPELTGKVAQPESNVWPLVIGGQKPQNEESAHLFATDNTFPSIYNPNTEQSLLDLEEGEDENIASNCHNSYDSPLLSVHSVHSPSIDLEASPKSEFLYYLENLDEVTRTRQVSHQAAGISFAAENWSDCLVQHSPGSPPDLVSQHEAGLRPGYGPGHTQHYSPRHEAGSTLYGTAHSPMYGSGYTSVHNPGYGSGYTSVHTPGYGSGYTSVHSPGYGSGYSSEHESAYSPRQGGVYPYSTASEYSPRYGPVSSQVYGSGLPSSGMPGYLYGTAEGLSQSDEPVYDAMHGSGSYPGVGTPALATNNEQMHTSTLYPTSQPLPTSSYENSSMMYNNSIASIEEPLISYQFTNSQQLTTDTYAYGHLPPASEQNVSIAGQLGRSSTVKVEKIPRKLNKASLEQFFQLKEHGGGEIVSTSMIGRTAFIKFKQPEVASRVATREVFHIDDHSVSVSLYQRKPDPLDSVLKSFNSETTLVLSSIPDSVSTEHLEAHIDAETGLKAEMHYKLRHHRDSLALVVVPTSRSDTHQYLFQTLSTSHRPLKKSPHTLLTVSYLEPVDGIFVSNIVKEIDFLNAYFSNRKKSGGGQIKRIRMISEHQALVSFVESAVVETLLNYDHTSKLGSDVTVQMYQPILSRLLRIPDVDIPDEDAPLWNYESLLHQLGKPLYQHIQKHSEHLTSFKERLQRVFATVTLDQGNSALLVKPERGSEYVRDWTTKIQTEISKFVGDFQVVTLEIPEDIAGRLYPVILAKIDTSQVTLSSSGAAGEVVLVGSGLEVEGVEQMVKKIINDNLDMSKEEVLPLDVLLLVKNCLYKELKEKHKQVIFEVNVQKCVLKVSGKASGCDIFLRDVAALKLCTVHINVPKEVLSFYESQKGQDILNKRLLGKEVTYMFKDEGFAIHDKSLDIKSLHLLGISEDNLSVYHERVKNFLQVSQVRTPKEFDRIVADRSDSWLWNKTRDSLESTYTCSIVPIEGLVNIVCEQQNIPTITAEVHGVIKDCCYKEVKVRIPQGHWMYLGKYSKEWAELYSRFSEAKITCSLPTKDDKLPTITLYGEVSPIKVLSAAFKKLSDKIHTKTIETSWPGMTNYFLSRAGRNQLEGIGAKHSAIVDVCTKAEKEKRLMLIESTRPQVICRASTGALKVEIVLGDLTEFSADVIVNAANTRLQHGGGLAGALSKKGGRVIQEESSYYVKNHGHLNPGDAILLKHVGKLECEAIIHAVGPQWNGGDSDEECILRKAVRESLCACASHGFKTIAFPAIGAGIFGVPESVCAHNMMQAIKEYAICNTRCSTQKVCIVLLPAQVGVARCFSEAAKRLLLDVVLEPNFSKQTFNQQIQWSEWTDERTVAEEGHDHESDLGNSQDGKEGDNACRYDHDDAADDDHHDDYKYKDDDDLEDDDNDDNEDDVDNVKDDGDMYSSRNDGMISIAVIEDDDDDDDQYPSSSVRLSESQRIENSKDVLDKLSLKDSYDSHVKSDGKSTVSSSEPGDVSTSQHHSTRSLSLVSVKEGSIMDYSVDAYVNSAHTSLNLSRGTLSRSLLAAGGSVMQAKCDKYVEANGPVRPGNIALIPNLSTSLQCRFVIHMVGRGYDGVGGLAEQVLKSSVLKVLEECDRQNLSTVAFPALGSGNLSFPPDVAANIMFSTMASYLANTKTSLKRILVVVQDKSIYATFHRVFASSQNSAPASAPSVAPIQFSPHPNSLYSTVYKLLNIEIVRGDITKDDSESIIACSSSQLLRPQGVMGALLAKGGKELQLECAAKVRMEGRLEQGKVMITRSGQPGGLLCRRILHIPIPDTPADIQDSVYNALKMADRKGLASVSMPAIGTGGNHISPYQAARSLCTAIMSFSTCSALKLKRIRVVLITEQHTSVFFSTFSSMLQSGNLANDNRGSERSIPHLLSHHTSIGGVKSLSHKSKETSNVFGKEVTVNVPKFSDPGLCVTIITADQDAMKDVVKEVNTTIQEYRSEQTVKGGRELPPPVQAELKQHALKLSVELSFDETKGIILRGNKIDVAQLKSDIQARLHAIEQAKSRQKEAELFAVKLQWKWKDNQGILHSYDPLTNLAIEEAYLDQKEQCVIHVTTNEETREGIVDLKTMTEKGSREEYTIVRYKVESESMKHEDERPISWTPMPLDLNGKEKVCHVVELLPGCDEYQVVAAEFHRTIGRAPVRRSYMPFPQYGISTVVSSSWEIAKIERIQNPTLYSQYMARKKEMEKSVDQGYEYERQLFHGCAKNAVESINHSGFNRSYAGLHATAYGKGVYFATEAQKSANDKYSTPDIGGVKRMYLAKVLVGEYATGRSSMIQPPAKRESALFNSVVDDTTNPSIFVIFSDAQVYPEYLIHFRSSYY